MDDDQPKSRTGLTPEIAMARELKRREQRRQQMARYRARLKAKGSLPDAARVELG